MPRILVLLLLCPILFGCRSREDHSDQRSTLVAIHDSSLANGRNLSGWSIQVGAFSDRAKAEDLRTGLAKSNLPAYLTVHNDGDGPLFYRVRVGPFASPEEAGGVSKKVYALGYVEAFVIGEETLPSSELADSVLAVPAVDSLQRKQLTREGRASHPAWSPTGREIAFYDYDNKGIYTIGTGGGETSRIIQSNRQRRILPTFAWSPSGRRMAFVVEEINQDWELAENLYVASKDGSGLRKLLAQNRFTFKIANLKWSPSGQYLAFDAKYKTDDYNSSLIQDVIVLALDESEVDHGNKRDVARVLEPTRGRDINWSVGWTSPHLFLFLSTYGKGFGESLTYEVWNYNMVERDRKVLLAGPVVNHCRQVEVASDYLLYSSFGKLMSVNLNSKQTRIITTADGDDHILSDIIFFATSTDSRVLFSRNEHIWLTALHGDSSPPLNLPVRASDFSVAPSGSRLCFIEDDLLFTIKLP